MRRVNEMYSSPKYETAKTKNGHSSNHQKRGERESVRNKMIEHMYSHAFISISHESQIERNHETEWA